MDRYLFIAELYNVRALDLQTNKAKILPDELVVDGSLIANDKIISINEDITIKIRNLNYSKNLNFI